MQLPRGGAARRARSGANADGGSSRCPAWYPSPFVASRGVLPLTIGNGTQRVADGDKSATPSSRSTENARRRWPAASSSGSPQPENVLPIELVGPDASTKAVEDLDIEVDLEEERPVDSVSASQQEIGVRLRWHAAAVLVCCPRLHRRATRSEQASAMISRAGARSSLQRLPTPAVRVWHSEVGSVSTPVAREPVRLANERRQPAAILRRSGGVAASLSCRRSARAASDVS